MSDPYEDLLESISRNNKSDHDILRDLLEELKKLRCEIVELTGAVFSLCEVKE